MDPMEKGGIASTQITAVPTNTRGSLFYQSTQHNEMKPVPPPLPPHDLDPPQNRLRDLRRCGFATKVRRQDRSLAQHGIHSDLDPSCRLAVAQVAEHHRGRADGSDWVRLVLACYIRCGAVYAGAIK